MNAFLCGKPESLETTWACLRMESCGLKVNTLPIAALCYCDLVYIWGQSTLIIFLSIRTSFFKGLYDMAVVHLWLKRIIGLN
jgi:hypothetical protein